MKIIERNSHEAEPSKNLNEYFLFILEFKNCAHYISLQKITIQPKVKQCKIYYNQMSVFVL